MIRRVEREGGARFQVYGRRGGRKVYVGSYDSRREAAEAEEDFKVTQRKIERGELPADLDEKRTLASAADAWLRSLKQTGSRSESIYRRRVDRHVLPTLGAAPLATIAKPHVMRWRDDLARALAPAHVNSMIGTLSSLFAYAIDQRWVGENPCAGLVRVEVPEATFRWLKSGDEIVALLAACAPTIRPIVALLVGTGMRVDEALHLRWTDVDLERRLIHVHRGRQGTTKSGKARPVPIFDNVLPMLRELALRRAGATVVFPNPDGKPRSKPGVFKPFKAALDRAGIDRKLRLHDLRHTFASLYLLDGGDIFRLSKILGHSTVATTERVYAHMKPDQWNQDYGRVAFHVPGDGGRVLQLAAV